MLVYDRLPEAVTTAVEHGAVAAAGAAELAAGVSVILTALPTPQIVEERLDRP